MGRKILVDADDLDLITSRHRYFHHADGEPCHCDNCQTERSTLMRLRSAVGADDAQQIEQLARTIHDAIELLRTQEGVEK